jgi:hypothetical protein
MSLAPLSPNGDDYGHKKKDGTAKCRQVDDQFHASISVIYVAHSSAWVSDAKRLWMIGAVAAVLVGGVGILLFTR